MLFAYQHVGKGNAKQVRSMLGVAFGVSYKFQRHYNYYFKELKGNIRKIGISYVNIGVAPVLKRLC